METAMNKTRLALIAGAVVLAGALSACNPHHFNKEDRAEHAAWIVESIGRKLDLNDAQKAKLDIVKTRLLAAREEADTRRDADAKEIVALLSQPTFDRARAEALVQSHTRAIETKAAEVIAAFGDFYDSLTPAQQQKLRERVESRINGHCF
jgi:protein CpxP